jgi:hypothetical protein
MSRSITLPSILCMVDMRDGKSFIRMIQTTIRCRCVSVLIAVERAYVDTCMHSHTYIKVDRFPARDLAKTCTYLQGFIIVTNWTSTLPLSVNTLTEHTLRDRPQPTICTFLCCVYVRYDLACCTFSWKQVISLPIIVHYYTRIICWIWKNIAQ